MIYSKILDALKSR